MVSKFILLLVFVIAIENSTELVLETKDCGSKLGELSSLDLNCDEGSSAKICMLSKGKKYEGKLKITPNTVIGNGTIVLHAIVAGAELPFPFPDNDLCKDHNVVCPLKADTQVTVDIAIDVPGYAPSLNIEAKLEIQSSGNEFICAEFLGMIK